MRKIALIMMIAVMVAAPVVAQSGRYVEDMDGWDWTRKSRLEKVNFVQGAFVALGGLTTLAVEQEVGYETAEWLYRHATTEHSIGTVVEWLDYFYTEASGGYLEAQVWRVLLALFME